MHIKQITIKGFRSYREQTYTEPFSEHHNVVVGRNGSGKSNFFFAIRFVLSDGFSSLRTEERQKLLHEGAGHAVSSAFVEIVFDNSDSRIPIDKQEVALRRSISVKNDDYYLDNKRINKHEVRNLLESAGFSRSNPYYIVQQGKITSLATASDVERLQLLMEVAGTSVYDERRLESLNILDDAHSKQNSIDLVLNEIETRLTELETERKELQQYQELDAKKRAIQFALYTQERKTIEEQAQKLEDRREDLSKRNIEANSNTSVIEKEISALQDKAQDLLSSLEAKDTQLTKIGSIIDKKERGCANLRAKYDEGIQEEKETDTKKSSTRADLQELEVAIENKQRKLEDILPKYESLCERKVQLTEELKDMEQERETLLQQQTLGSEYGSVEERDAFLNEQIKQYKQSLNENERLLKSTTARFTSSKASLQAKQEKLERMEQQISDLRNERSLTVSSLQDLHHQRNTIQNTYRKQQADVDAARVNLTHIKDRLKSAEKRLMDTTKRAIRDGIASIKSIVEKDRVQGVFGPLIDLIRVHDQFVVPADVTAGNALFNIVVDTNETVTLLLRKMNERKLQGRVSFMPLNRIKRHKQSFEGSDEILPLTDFIECDDRFTKVVEFIYGSTFVVRDLSIANTISSEHRIDFITLEGHKQSSKNVLTGGYVDTSTNKLRLHSEVEELRFKLEELEHVQETLETQLATTDAELSKVLAEIRKVDRDGEEVKTRLIELQANTVEERKEINKTGRDVKEYEASLKKHEANVSRQSLKIEGLMAELGTDLNSQLDTQDYERSKELSEKIEGARKELSSVIDELSPVDGLKTQLETNINENLLKQKADLIGALESLEDVMSQDVEVMKVTLDNSEKELIDLQKQLQSLVEERNQLDATRMDIEDELKKKRQLLSLENVHSEEWEKNLAELHGKRKQLDEKKEKVLDQINYLGPLRSGDYDAFTDISTSKLQNKLRKVNQNLQRFGHVNKKAMDQYISFSEQRDALTGRKDQQKSGHEAIVELIRVLDSQKNEAILFTFKQVSNHFAKVFKELVPSGDASLVMIRDKAVNFNGTPNDNYDEEGEEEEEEDHSVHTGAERRRGRHGRDDEPGDSNGATAEVPTHAHLRNSNALAFSGVAISVRFAKGETKTRNLHQLSGGQKSLVALALIFAIQRSDPAPFYLFDEIDQALDPAHRKGVADMIHKGSRRAQYITTTFRPELLENCDKCYGVTFANKVSRLSLITKEQAQEFIEDTTE
eukprot:m.41964 g.41964  ORF g.41964 m.41964 type:complete len:1241 (+) comp7032_c0_seq1:319-4041(+)